MIGAARRLAALATLALGLVSVHASAWEPAAEAAVVRDALDACLARLDGATHPSDPDQPIQLIAHCPELEPVLDQAFMTLPFDRAHSAQSSRAQLLDYRALLDSYLLTPRAAPALDFVGLPGLLHATFQDEPVTPPGWWLQFKEWLTHLFSSEYTPDLSWLAHFLDNIALPPRLAEWLFRISMALILLLALAVVANELRHAGITRRWGWTRLPRGGVAGPPGAVSDGAIDLESLRRLAPAAQAPALLRAVIATLSARGQLPPERSHTNREYLMWLHGAHAAGIVAFARLVDAAEAVLFGQQGIDAATAAGLYRDAQSLLTQDTAPHE